MSLTRRLQVIRLLESIAYTLLVPAAASIGIVYLARLVLPADLYHRFTPAVAAAAAFFIGYALLPDWAPLVPERHWQWLPYLVVAISLLASSGLASGVWLIERRLCQLLFAVVTAYFIVPTWETLQPTRPWAMAILSVYLVAIVALAEPLVTRFVDSRLYAIFSLVALANCVAIGVAVSVKFGQLGGIFAAAIVGVWIASRTLASDLKAASVVSPAVMSMGCLAFVAAIEPAPPLFDLLLIPAAPLMLWLFTMKQANRRAGLLPAIAQTIAVLAPIALVFVRMVLAELNNSE